MGDGNVQYMTKLNGVCEIHNEFFVDSQFCFILVYCLKEQEKITEIHILQMEYNIHCTKGLNIPQLCISRKMDTDHQD